MKLIIACFKHGVASSLIGFWGMVFKCCRNPEATSRPMFCNIITELQQPDFKILKWSENDKAISSEKAMTLGAPIEEGASLFKDLQHTYMQKQVV